MSLKHLTNGLIDKKTLADAINRLSSMEDGPTAIIGGALIDAALERFLRFQFRHLGKKQIDGLMEWPQPLSSASAKIKMAHALKHLDARSFHDCEKINQIRNAFAHTLLAIDFEHPDIKALISSFELVKWIRSEDEMRSIYDNLALADQLVGAKGDFVSTVRALYGRIWVLRSNNNLIVTDEVAPLLNKHEL